MGIYIVPAIVKKRTGILILEGKHIKKVQKRIMYLVSLNNQLINSVDIEQLHYLKHGGLWKFKRLKKIGIRLYFEEV
jgi:hypothetical protein